MLEGGAKDPLVQFGSEVRNIATSAQLQLYMADHSCWLVDYPVAIVVLTDTFVRALTLFSGTHVR